MDEQSVRIKRLSAGARLPRRATAGSSGFDLFACLEDGGSVRLGTGPSLVGTGIAMEAPEGFDVQIRPRSGLSSQGVGVALGTVDSDYRGEIKVTMYMFDPAALPHEVRHGDRIAQMVIVRLAPVRLIEADELADSERGAGGHGSTGR